MKVVKQASEREHECLQTPGSTAAASSRASLQTSAVGNVSVCLVSKNSNSKTEQLIKGLVSV